MPNYKEAFKKGMDEAIKVQAAKKEIAAIFNEFQQEIQQLGEKKLIVELGESSSRASVIQKIQSSAGMLGMIEKEIPREFDIVVRNPTLGQQTKRTIARWQPSLYGYPVKLSWEDQERYCNDKESLEIALADLIANPSVAEKLLITMNEKPQNAKPTHPKQ